MTNVQLELFKNLFPSVLVSNPPSHISAWECSGGGSGWAESVLTLCAHTIIIMPKKPAQMNGEMRLWRVSWKGGAQRTHSGRELFCIARVSLMRGWWSLVILVAHRPRYASPAADTQVHMLCVSCAVTERRSSHPFPAMLMACEIERDCCVLCARCYGVRLWETPPRRTCTGSHWTEAGLTTFRSSNDQDQATFTKF